MPPWEIENQNSKWIEWAPIFSEAEHELQKIAEKKQAQKQNKVRR